ncbi:MAG TPA: glycine zipper 2TM domain-containing protein [Burkholderiales bacterium]|nr:glycine zipper 2TM domain-containing protein [Burkholderiales bacterium]
MEQASTRTHPMLVAAAAAVLVFSLLGAAALTGVLPAGNTKSSEVVAPDAAAQKIPVDHPAAHLSTAKTAAAPCANCGVIESVHAVEVKGSTSGVGAVAGGVAGGVLGNQFGHGGTRTLLTIGGAAGGAYAGNEIERNVKKHTEWRIAVRLEDGSLRTLARKEQPPFAVGDRVRIVDGSGIERV